MERDERAARRPSRSVAGSDARRLGWTLPETRLASFHARTARRPSAETSAVRRPRRGTRHARARRAATSSARNAPRLRRRPSPRSASASPPPTAGAGSGDSAEGSRRRRVGSTFGAAGEGGGVPASSPRVLRSPRTRTRRAAGAGRDGGRRRASPRHRNNRAGDDRTRRSENAKKCTKDEVPPASFSRDFSFLSNCKPALIYVQFSDVKPRAASVFAIARSRSPHSSAASTRYLRHMPTPWPPNSRRAPSP